MIIFTINIESIKNNAGYESRIFDHSKPNISVSKRKYRLNQLKEL